MNALAGIIRPRGYKPEDRAWLQQLEAGFPIHFRSGNTFHTGPLMFRGEGFSESAAGMHHVYSSGSIFNRGELTAAMNGDAALIRELIEHDGPDAIARINGQFTIISVDAREERIQLFNDHAGINQLFYFEGDGFTLFASEIRFLLAHPQCPCAIDWESALRRPSPVTVLSSFIDYRTWFRDIHLLPEAGIYEYEVRERNRSVRRYWDGLEATADPADTRTAGDVMREYMALLEDAVKIRCDQQAPTHAFLSGGLDSSAICALAGRHRPLESYSIITQTTCLEGTTPVCHELAEELGIGNTQFLIPYHEVSFDKQLWKQRIWRAESPVNHTDSTTKTLLHYAIQRNVPEAKTILTGTGSDQFNGGLARYIVHEEGSRAASAASLFRKLRESEIRKLISRDDEEFWRKRDFIRRDYLSSLKNESLENNSWNFYVRSAVHGEIYSLLWDEVRAAASTGHEVRFPFLDYRFSAFIAAIPERLHAELFWDKRILREPAKELLPASVLDKPKAPPYRREYDIRFRLFEYLTSGPDSLLTEAFGDPDVPHPVIDKKHLFARVEALKKQPEIMEWQDIMHLINLALLEKLPGKWEADLAYESRINPEHISFENDADETYRQLQRRLGIRSREELLDAPLSFAAQCSLLADTRRGTHYLSKENTLAYELDDSFPEWLRFLKAIDGKRSTIEILRDEMLELQSIEEFLQIAAQDGILTFTKILQPA